MALTSAACMESAWTAVLASHKGLQASAPHNSPTIHASEPRISVRTRGRHIFPNVGQPHYTLALCRGRFSLYVSWEASKIWRLQCWWSGPWSLLSKGDFEKETACPVHISVFPEEPWDVLFHLAMAQTRTHKITVVVSFSYKHNEISRYFLWNNFEPYPPCRTQKSRQLGEAVEVLQVFGCWSHASSALAEASLRSLGPKDQLHGRPPAAPAAVFPSTFLPGVSVPATGDASEAWQEDLDVHKLDTPSHHFVGRRQCDPVAHSSHSKHRRPQQP